MYKRLVQLSVVVLVVVPAPPFVLALPPQNCHVPLILQNLLPFESVTTSVEPVAFGTFGAVTLGVVPIS
ncbi:hypothetical protein QG028_09945, partial [Kingella kingae]|nr:hypothetical protein [Kingella kingae]